jgi:hypothetical protein
MVVEMKDRNYDLTGNVESLKRKNESLEKHHRKLIKIMSLIEVEHLDGKNEHIRIITESNNLKARVKQLTQSET